LLPIAHAPLGLEHEMAAVNYYLTRKLLFTYKTETMRTFENLLPIAQAPLGLEHEMTASSRQTFSKVNYYLHGKLLFTWSGA